MALLQTIESMEDQSRFNTAFHDIVREQADAERMRHISREAAIARGRPVVSISSYDNPEIYLG